MKKSRRVTVGLVVLCCVSLIAAFIVGISDNPPGLVLCYLATVSLILAFVHTWRKVKYFLILLGASVVGFAVFSYSDICVSGRFADWGNRWYADGGSTH